MPLDHPAFVAGEPVRFATYEALEKLQAAFGVNGPQGRKWIHDLLPVDWTEHAGKFVRIDSVSSYHFGTILYELKGIRGSWLEACLVDLGFDDPSGSSGSRPAHMFYKILADAGEDEPGMVEIRGLEDDRIYCAFHKHQAGREAGKIAEVSGIRSKAGFEARYGFDGSSNRCQAC